MQKQAIKRKTRKEKQETYSVSVRLDPKTGNFARVIRDATISCDKSVLYKRIAALEAYLAHKHPDLSSYVVDISLEREFRLADEDSRLSEEERKKIDEHLPGMLRRGYSELDRLTNDFALSGTTHYIG